MSGQTVKKDSIIKDALILFAITLVAGLLLGFVYELTKGPIDEVQTKAKTEAYQSAYPTADKIEAIEDEAIVKNVEGSEAILTAAGLSGVVINEILDAKDASGNLDGYVLSVTDSSGYGGDITISLGIGLDGGIKGIQILTMNETPGLGSRASEPEFLNQFIGKNAEEITYTKTGAAAENEIDAISGATITTAAVTKAVNAGIYFANNCMEGR